MTPEQEEKKEPAPDKKAQPATLKDALPAPEKKTTEQAPDTKTPAPEAKPEPDFASWTPKTALGKSVKAREITDIDEILNTGAPILEAEITEALLPNLQSDLLMIGQSRGKFGGGARRIFKQTQKKTPEGNKPSFTCYAVVGNANGYVGGSMGKSKDTVPSREKSMRNAKCKVFKIRRGCGSWECGCKTAHSIPFAVEGKCGSVRIKLMPAPKGKGLVIEQECAKILRLAGIKDVWSKTWGQTQVKHNLVTACLSALRQLMEIKMRSQAGTQLGTTEGAMPAEGIQ